MNPTTTLADTLLNLGPIGGILSAFGEKSDCAWLVISCDMPLLDHSGLKQLTNQQNIECFATAFQNAETGLPEQLVTIWEPKRLSEVVVIHSPGNFLSS